MSRYSTASSARFISLLYPSTKTYRLFGMQPCVLALCSCTKKSMVSPWLTVSIRSISSSCSTRRSPVNILFERAMVVESLGFFVSLTKTYIVYKVFMFCAKLRRKRNIRFGCGVQRTFKRTNVDYIITIMFIIAFIYAFFFASFHPMKDADGNIIYKKMDDGTFRTIAEINAQVFIAPIVLIYEMFQLFVLPGKTRLKYLPWRFWTALLIFIIYKKIKDGIDELSTT